MRALYDSKSKGNDRGIKKLLTKEAKIESWLLAEAALADAQAEEGFIPRSAADNIIENAKLERIDLEEMDRIQAKVGHGFVPFVKVPPGVRMIAQILCLHFVDLTHMLFLGNESFY